MYPKPVMKRALRESFRDTTRATHSALTFLEKLRASKDFSDPAIDKALWHIENVIDEQFGYTDRLRISHKAGFLSVWAAEMADTEGDFLGLILEALYLANRAAYLLCGQLVADRIGKQAAKERLKAQAKKAPLKTTCPETHFQRGTG